MRLIAAKESAIILAKKVCTNLSLVLRPQIMPHYARAPIKEALIDIRVDANPDLTFDDLHAVARLVESWYPLEETRNLGQSVIQFGPSAVQATAHQQPWALVFRNTENTQVLQARLDGFTFSRLVPYEDFEHLRDEARRLWDIYRNLTRPRRVNRVAVRYINELHLPGAKVEPEDYFNIFPHVSKDLRSELRDFGRFFMSLQLYQYDLRGILVLNLATALQPSPKVGIILDLDLFVENPPIVNEEQLWSYFDRLRVRKNEYFEAAITNRTRELIS